MDEAGDHVKRNKPDSERRVSEALSLMEDLDHFLNIKEI
jgi:hypothetical protein